MTSSYKVLQLACGSALLALSLGANGAVIDLFNEGPQNVKDPGGTGGKTSEAGNYPASIVGGYRDIGVVTVSGGFDYNDGTGAPPPDGTCGDFDSCSRMTVVGGTLAFSNDAPSVVGQGVVEWDGMDGGVNFAGSGTAADPYKVGDPTLDGNFLDFVNQPGCEASGCNELLFEVKAADLGFLFTIEAYTSANEFTIITFASLGGAVPVRSVLFDAWENPANCGGSNPAEGIVAVTCGPGNQTASFSSLDSFRTVFNITGTAAIDLAIGSVTKRGVPEPSTIILMGLGLAAAGGLARRRCGKA